jgi:hypothetical protein
VHEQLEFCRGGSEYLCVKSAECWLQMTRVIQSGDAQNGVDFCQLPVSLTAIFSGVRVFTLPSYFFSVEPVASKFRTQVFMAWADGTARLR